jgi:alpha-beta hydrolase superfamily lysophospholipase
MTHQKIDLRIGTGEMASGRAYQLAVTVHLPKMAAAAQRPPLLVCLPGAGYNRRYFDLEESGYSQAAHHTAHGAVVIAIDHLRVGESDMPESEEADLYTAAAANHAVLRTVVERLKTGRLSEAIGAIVPSALIGAGQSLGGHIAILMQALHRSFDGLAVLGSSVVSTRLLAPRTGQEICLLGKKDPAEAMAAVESFDWRFAFHWEDVPERFAGPDTAAKGGKAPVPYWGSATFPEATVALLPGFIAREAAMVSAPVLLGMGERDVCQDPLRELAAFMSTRDLSLFVAPRMGHMHNFAGTRELLWRRLDAFIAQMVGV